MNSQRDGDNQGSMVDFAVQLQVMVIILLFAALWWFESRLDKIEVRTNQAATTDEVERIFKSFMKEPELWQTANEEIKKFK
jgi:hypothetical protein